MSGIGTGYDLDPTTFSPDGRVFQVEYAQKAVENSGTVIGLRAQDGVLLAVEKLIPSKMLVDGSNTRLHAVDTHIGIASAGMLADARQLVKRARSECKAFRSFYSDPIPVRVLAERLALLMQLYTVRTWIRPFGCSVLVAGIDDRGPQLFEIDPSGTHIGHFGCSAGKGHVSARTEMEKLRLGDDGVQCGDLLMDAAKIIELVHDSNKDKPFELEMAWVRNGVFETVPSDLRVDAIARAKAAVADDEEEDD